MTIYKQLIAVSIVLVGTGAIIAAPLGMSWLEQQQALAASPNSIDQPVTSQLALPDTPEIIKGSPRHIIVPSLGIDVAIADGFYDAHTGEWTLSEDSAFYGTPTAPINSDSGNTLVYGHNSEKIFGKLLQLQPGAEVIVTTDNGYKFTYIYQSTQAVKPTDTTPLAHTSKPRLTLQTCSGPWNQTRQMFYFDLKSYDKV